MKVQTKWFIWSHYFYCKLESIKKISPNQFRFISIRIVQANENVREWQFDLFSLNDKRPKYWKINKHPEIGWIKTNPSI